MLACDVGDLKMVDLLLRSNADSDLQQPVGIHTSYNDGQSHVINRWAGYKLHCKWVSKVHAITVEGIIKVLLTTVHPLLHNHVCMQRTGYSALMLAAKAGHLEVVKRLIADHPQLDVTDKVQMKWSVYIETTLCVLHMDLDVNVIQSIGRIHNIKLEFRELWFGGHGLYLGIC